MTDDMVTITGTWTKIPRKDAIFLKDGTVVPADDFWLYAPTWVALKYGEPVRQKTPPAE